jgi:hypothetical protein
MSHEWKIRQMLRKWITWYRGLAIALCLGMLVAGGLSLLRFKRSCVFKGKRYYSGQAVPSDDCNASYCIDGEVMSTLLACRPYEPGRDCHRRDDAIDAAGWRASRDFLDEFPGQVIRYIEFPHMEKRAYYWLFQIRIGSTKLPPKLRSVWVIGNPCQSGVSESEPILPMVDGN